MGPRSSHGIRVGERADLKPRQVVIPGSTGDPMAPVALAKGIAFAYRLPFPVSQVIRRGGKALKISLAFLAIEERLLFMRVHPQDWRPQARTGGP